jgi:hypothetical protein
MPDKKISQLTAGTIAISDSIPFSTATDTWKATPADVVSITNADKFAMNFIIGNAGTVAIETVGMYPYFRTNRAGTITACSISSGTVVGNATIDIWKGNYATPPTGTAQSIIGTATKPSFAGSTKYQSTALTWGTVAFGSGDIFAINLVGVGTIPFLSVMMDCRG